MRKHGVCAICTHRESMEFLGLVQPVSGVYWGLWRFCSWVRGASVYNETVTCKGALQTVSVSSVPYAHTAHSFGAFSETIWSQEFQLPVLPVSCFFFSNCNPHYKILPFEVKFSGLNIFKRFCIITSIWEQASFIYHFTENPCTQHQPLLLSACARDPLLGPNSAYSRHSVCTQSSVWWPFVWLSHPA